MLGLVLNTHKNIIVIDNNKAVCKKFHKLGIDCMRFKEAD